ncbi:MAG: beta-ribofuranosylaminobenzene 5'-phosphate synthase [Methylibium sp. NZG]|nr:MAG: beta-ribofuranosylaminobenzene 5'-phosphate synthase [Methylibium sp. NZG]
MEARLTRETVTTVPSDGRVLTLRAPGRLHLGFLDPAATLGRRFGSLGLVIDGFETALELSASSTDRISATTPAAQAEVERVSAHLHALRERSGRHAPLRLRLMRVLPAHAGLGSGTQLALAVGRAFAQWHGLGVDTVTLATWLGRGLRSGVGIAGFDQGGLLLDGGPGADGTPAPLLARVALPQAWRIVIVCDPGHHGLSGEQEREAIATLPDMPRAQAADLCHQVLMRVLPSAAHAEFAPFAAGINRLQRVLGAHFAPVQGGSAYTSPRVGALMRWMGQASGIEQGSGQGAERGAGQGGEPGDEHRAEHDAEHSAHRSAAIGQSSWGPTGFAIVASQGFAESLVERARAAGVIDPALAVQIVRPRNHGADLSEHGVNTPRA